MEASRTRPGARLTLPSDSPVGSIESLASSSGTSSSSGSRSQSHSPAKTGCDIERTTGTEPERSSGSGNGNGNGNVMITLSLTPDPPVSSTPPAPPTVTPSRPPFPRSHIRSRSLADGPDVPVMIRAHSSPGLDSRGRYIFVHGRGAPANTAAAAAASTPNSKAKRYLPLQLSTADSFDPSSTSPSLSPRMLHRKNISETISEHAELDTSGSSTTSTSHSEFNPSSPVLSHATPRLGRRRPSSPLHFPQTPTSNTPGGGFVPGSPSFSATHSPPLMLSTRYNEAFPSYSASSASSIPSTPTSLRSRSPSISSLETIPDIPDAEAEALESDRIAALKAAADRADDADAVSMGTRRRGVSDMAGPSSTARTGGGYRKRWSVCGAERRGDLDLETIWED
ncbi:uncharacterized protein BDV14DRAFT_85791 [Aspergillus stella-maris]|uniref:uncharacterized protein n=1 Tax=Aspergillus stella-maris TaxID=1810926 RepID=UPI003CCD1C49